MTPDFTRLSPAELVRLLNSTRLGTVINERRLYRHRQMAGLRIGDRDHVHLIRYGRWLAEQLADGNAGLQEQDESMARKRKAKPSTDGRTAYQQHRERAAQRQRQQSAEGRDIGDIPPPANPTRREECRENFRLFCERYFPERFYLQWSDDHLKAIARIEACVLRGGLFALAMPRKGGKTALMEAAAIWGIVYGLHPMASLLGATAEMGGDLLDSVKMALETNERMAEDFPEICLPIREIEGQANRCTGQRQHGAKTWIRWGKKVIVLPRVMVPDPAGGVDGDGNPKLILSPASNAVIKCGGLTGGSVRGQHYTRPDGFVVRPSLVLLDDPQTDKTATSPTANKTRVKLLMGAVLGMAGPTRKIAAMMPCTVIAPDDMADRILSTDKHPEWNGMRTKLVYEFPSNEKLWDEYAVLRSEGIRNGDEGQAATEFYRLNRAAMDEGAAVAWPAFYEPDELSAIQYAMNLKLRDEEAFFAEYQNEPITAHADAEFATVEQIAAKQNGTDRIHRLSNGEWGMLPVKVQHVAAFADVHKQLIYWTLIGWEENFTGYVLDYGTFPDQHLRYFTLRSAKRTLGRVVQGAGQSGAILAGLQAVSADLLGRVFRRDDGSTLKVGGMFIDSGWGEETQTVYQAVRDCPTNLVWPSKGEGKREAKSVPGCRRGDHWRMVPTKPGTAHGRLVLINRNYWVTFVQRRLVTARGDAGCLSLWGKLRTDGTPASADLHRMFAEHATAVTRHQMSRDGSTFDAWDDIAGRDVHFLDCLVGCAVVGEMLGCRLVKGLNPPKTSEKRKTKSLAQLAAEARR